jgi:tungstate transport system substrate-binding protein
MAATLTMASEKQAYTLTDRGTYLALKARLNLLTLLQGDPLLLNRYGIIAVNPQKHPTANYHLAGKFIEFMTSSETQKLISEFGKDKYGEPLFYPDSEEWHSHKEN